LVKTNNKTKKKKGKPSPQGKRNTIGKTKMLQSMVYCVVLFGDVIGFWVRLSLGCFRFESPMVAE